MTVIIGIDPHKSSHTATALVAGLTELGTIRVRATIDQLLAWAQPWPQRRWAIEGAHGLGQLLAQRLVAAGEIVVDVPPPWPLGPGCSRPVMPARPTIPTSVAWPSSPPSARTWPASRPMTTPVCCACSPIAATSYPESDAGR